MTVEKNAKQPPCVSTSYFLFPLPTIFWLLFIILSYALLVTPQLKNIIVFANLLLCSLTQLFVNFLLGQLIVPSDKLVNEIAGAKTDRSIHVL
jgi:hypothetical protein